MEIMHLKKIRFTNFRNFKKEMFEFSDDITVIVGPNAVGKTNILESVFLLSTGKSFHARREEEMIGYNAEIARISALVDRGKWMVDGEEENKITQPTTHNPLPTTKLEIVLTRGQIDIGTEHPEKVPRKKLLVNGIARHLYNFAGNLKIVLFGPWDMDLVTESPSIRRRFLDNVLSQVDREYRRASLSYEKGIRQRNRLLFRIREEGVPRSSLLFWDQLIVKTGNYITKRREEFIEYVNNFQIQISKSKLNGSYDLDYDKSTISEGRLEQYKEEEVAAATTLVGPHRDDLVFKIQNPRSKLHNGKYRELARYGSRGEQRMGVLWLKLTELSFIEAQTQERPVLLLDDIFSELDHEHRDIVMDIVKAPGQVIITTADEHFLEGISKKSIISL